MKMIRALCCLAVCSPMAHGMDSEMMNPELSYAHGKIDFVWPGGRERVRCPATMTLLEEMMEDEYAMDPRLVSMHCFLPGEDELRPLTAKRFEKVRTRAYSSNMDSDKPLIRVSFPILSKKDKYWLEAVELQDAEGARYTQRIRYKKKIKTLPVLHALLRHNGIEVGTTHIFWRTDQAAWKTLIQSELGLLQESALHRIKLGDSLG